MREIETFSEFDDRNKIPSSFAGSGSAWHEMLRRSHRFPPQVSKSAYLAHVCDCLLGCSLRGVSQPEAVIIFTHTRPHPQTHPHRYSTTSVYTELRDGARDGDDGSRLLTIENHLGVPVSVTLEDDDTEEDDLVPSESPSIQKRARSFRIKRAE